MLVVWWDIQRSTVSPVSFPKCGPPGMAGESKELPFVCIAEVCPGCAKKFRAQVDQQSKSIQMTSLTLRVKQPLKPVPESDWHKLSSEAAAMKYAIALSHRQDKSIAIDADIDPAILSRAKAGQARLNETDMDAFMDAAGSEAPLYAFLLRRGYDPRCLRKLETETERELREAREQIARMQAEREIELRLMKELRA